MAKYKIVFIDQRPYVQEAEGFEWDADTEKITFWDRTRGGAAKEVVAVLNGDRVESVVKQNG